MQIEMKLAFIVVYIILSDRLIDLMSNLHFVTGYIHDQFLMIQGYFFLSSYGSLRDGLTLAQILIDIFGL